MMAMGIGRQALLVVAVSLVAACASEPARPPEPAPRLSTEELLFLNRVTWGANASSARALVAAGRGDYLEAQLDPRAPDVLPAEVQAQIDAMTISQRPAAELAAELERRRRDFQGLADPEPKK